MEQHEQNCNVWVDCSFKRHWKHDNPLSLCLSSSRSYHVCSSPLFFPQFGDSQQLRLVRILRSTVMVRVGGGWMALDEFLVKNDPCRGTSDISAGGNLLFRDMKKKIPGSAQHWQTQHYSYLHSLLLSFISSSFTAFFSISILILSVLSEFNIFHYLPITSWPPSHGGCF